MPPRLKVLKGRALNLLFPQRCVGCGKEGNLICTDCYHTLPHIIPPVCPKCGKPQSDDTLCPTCVNWQTQIDGIRAPFRFEGIIRQAIHQLKYKNIRTLAEPLSDLLGDYLTTTTIPMEVIVPVPLHPARLRERGYNQSGLLANHLGESLNLPVVHDCLVRTRPALPQARTSSVDERRCNVAGAFTCRDRRLNNKQVLLLDDVSTSGATIDACASALKANGATTVWGLTLSREI